MLADISGAPAVVHGQTQVMLSRCHLTKVLHDQYNQILTASRYEADYCGYDKCVPSWVGFLKRIEVFKRCMKQHKKQVFSPKEVWFSDADTQQHLPSHHNDVSQCQGSLHEFSLTPWLLT